jgi:RNA polymerase sigma-70 factor (ECF subfamily)
LVNEKEIIQACIKNDRLAQKSLYESYSPVLFAIIKRYIKDVHISEDILIDSFMKIFDHLKKFEGKGSFEGWMKRIAVNQCLMHLRKNNVFHLTIESDNIVLPFETQIEEDIDFKTLLKVLDLLPVGYRTVFNLYVVEGYKHKDIAEELGISINTSKSQLRLAKERLKKILKQQQISITG